MVCALVFAGDRPGTSHPCLLERASVLWGLRHTASSCLPAIFGFVCKPAAVNYHSHPVLRTAPCPAAADSFLDLVARRHASNVGRQLLGLWLERAFRHFRFLWNPPHYYRRPGARETAVAMHIAMCTEAETLLRLVHLCLKLALVVFLGPPRLRRRHLTSTAANVNAVKQLQWDERAGVLQLHGTQLNIVHTLAECRGQVGTSAR